MIISLLNAMIIDNVRIAHDRTRSTVRIDALSLSLSIVVSVT